MGPTSSAPSTFPYLTGWALTSFSDTHDAVLDELVYDVASRAMRDCGVRKHEIGLSVTASLDVYDGRSISSGLTNSAAGGYLADSYRIEGDAALAIDAARDAVMAGDVDVALAVAVFNPETRTTAGSAGREFLGQLSNYAFDPHFDRPIGLYDDAALALQATGRLEAGDFSIAGLADTAAALISRGASSARAFRSAAVTARDVLAARSVCTPLTELMLPAVCAGAGAVVIMSPARAARARGRSIRLVGTGHGVGTTTSAGGWLHDPAAGVRRAAALAYRSAGFPDDGEVPVSSAEPSCPTPCLVDPVAAALRLSVDALGDRFLRSGGVASTYPGTANGILRLVELAEDIGDDPPGTYGVAHATTAITGTVLGGDVVMVAEVV